MSLRKREKSSDSLYPDMESEFDPCEQKQSTLTTEMLSQLPNEKMKLDLDLVVGSQERLVFIAQQPVEKSPFKLDAKSLSKPLNNRFPGDRRLLGGCKNL